MNVLLRRSIEEIVGKIYKIELLDEQGCTSEVHQIVTECGSFLLKSSFKDKYRDWLKAEALVLEKLNKHGLIPVPNYYGYIEFNNSSHLIMEFINGITLTSALKNAKIPSERKLLIRSFGHFLFQLHETKILDCMNYRNDWLNEQLLKAEYYVHSGQTEGGLKLLEELKSKRPLPVKQTLIHGDSTTDNVLVVDGEVKCFIDVFGMTVGDPRYDEALAIRSFVNNDDYKKAFYEGYKRYKITKEEYQYFEEGLYEFF